jgi:hypothetical protein
MDGKTKMATDVKTLPYAALLSPEAIEAGLREICKRDRGQLWNCDCPYCLYISACRADEKLARAAIEAAIAEARKRQER